MRFSLIIVSKDRPGPLAAVLESAARALPADGEVMVVDGDPERSAEAVVTDLRTSYPEVVVRYVTSDSGAARGATTNVPTRSTAMRTYVRMGPTAYRPARELERAAERGELDIAVGIAKDLARERGRPIPLNLALVLLPLIAARQPEAYDGWALRWLGRWIAETPDASIDAAVDVAAGLAMLPVEPEAVEAVRWAGG